MRAAKEVKNLVCDYLVVGAGAAPLAFIDTLLTELPDAKIILIDKKVVPGGHWVDAYGFVQLHQPSIVYGIASKQLEGNWLKLMFKGMLPWTHRASKKEIVKYFGDFVQEKVDAQQVEFYPNTIFEFEKSNDAEKTHFFSSVDGSVSYKVQVNEKLVDGTVGQCIIPHESPLQFPVDDKVRVMTPNQIYDAFENGDKAEKKSMLDKKYVVLGAGKTGMDSIVYLQRHLKVDPSDIAWVISADVWMLNAAGGGKPSDWPNALAEHNNDQDKAALALEEKGMFSRLDKNIVPKRFRFPSIQPDDLKLLQKIKTIVRRGRATAIRQKYNSDVVVEFGSDFPAWKAFAPMDKCVFVHATSPGPFNSRASDEDSPIFNSPGRMTLRLLFTPPISFSMSVLGKVEAARRKGTLDLDVMRNLALALGGEKSKANELTENDMLKMLLAPLTMPKIYRTMLTQAILFAIVDRDPMEVINWFKGNRLSFLSIPGFKSGACDDIRMLTTKQNVFKVPDAEVSMMKLVGEKIKPLEGM